MTREQAFSITNSATCGKRPPLNTLNKNKFSGDKWAKCIMDEDAKKTSDEVKKFVEETAKQTAGEVTGDIQSDISNIKEGASRRNLIIGVIAIATIGILAGGYFILRKKK